MKRLSIALAATAACLAAPLAAQTTTSPAAAPPTAPAPVPAMVDAPCPPAEVLPPVVLNMMRIIVTPPAERATLLQALTPEQRGQAEAIRAMFAPPAERAAILQTLTPEQRAQAEAMRVVMDKKQADQKARDWPNLCQYKAANAQVITSGRPDIVFMGDSITEIWKLSDSAMFDDKIVDRGISGQTTPQMLVRFMQDVVSLRPRAVHILAGTNDIAGNTGPNAPEDYMNNIRAMVALAKANGIAVILGSIPPCNHFFFRPDLKPAPQVVALNTWLRDFAAKNHVVYVDYYAALVDGQGGFKAALTPDGVHPNRDGFALMKPLAQAAIRNAK